MAFVNHRYIPSPYSDGYGWVGGPEWSGGVAKNNVIFMVDFF